MAVSIGQCVQHENHERLRRGLRCRILQHRLCGAGHAQQRTSARGQAPDARLSFDPETDRPVDAGGWINLYLGYIQIPGVVGGAGSQDFESATVAIGGFIEKVIKESGKDFMQAKAIFASASDEAKARKMIAAAASIDSYSTDELTADIATICKCLKALDGKDREPSAIVAALT